MKKIIIPFLVFFMLGYVSTMAQKTEAKKSMAEVTIAKLEESGIKFTEDQKTEVAKIVKTTRAETTIKGKKLTKEQRKAIKTKVRKKIMKSVVTKEQKSTLKKAREQKKKDKK